MADYCDPSDIYTLGGLPRVALQLPIRQATASGSTITLAAHGLATGDEVQVRAQSGGVLPTGIAAGTTYYWIRLSSDTGQLAATSGGAAISLSTTGTVPWGVYSLPDAAIAAAITASSRIVDANCDSHGGYADYFIRQATAKIAVSEIARRLANEYRWGLDAIQAAVDGSRDAIALLRRVATKDIRDKSPNQPTRGPLYGGSDSRGWGGSVP
jgi:hypothetical protein